jgi:alpha-beta hydrolase superfamily lysophospholipase
VQGNASLVGAAGQRREEEGYWEAARGVRLYHCDWLPSAESRASAHGGGALVVLLHGYAEHCRRYDELANFLLGRGYGVCRFDARGHGKSSGQRGYASDHAEYVSEAKGFIAFVQRRHPGWPLLLLGHSHGGLVAIRALQQGLAGVTGLVLTSPLLALPKNRRPVPDGVARCLSAVAARLPLPNGVHAHDLTHDLALQEAHRVDEHVHRFATPRWYWGVTLAGRLALAEVERVTVPVLTVRGELDTLVDTAAIAQFYAALPAIDKQLLTRVGERHEVLNEIERRSLFVTIADWMDRVLAARGPLDT